MRKGCREAGTQGGRDWGVAKEGEEAQAVAGPAACVRQQGTPCNYVRSRGWLIV